MWRGGCTGDDCHYRAKPESMLCCCCFSHSVYWLPTRETTLLHEGKSRSWSAEQGKENKIKKSGSIPPPVPHPPPPTLLVHATHRQTLRRSRSASRPYMDIFGPSTRPHYGIYIFCWLEGLNQTEQSVEWFSRQRTHCAARRSLSVQPITSERDWRRGVLPASGGFMGCW